MRITREIKVGGATVTVRELTVAEVRAWLRTLEAGIERDDLVGELLVEDVARVELQMLSDGLTPEVFEAATQSELRDLAATARELNPDFFRLRARLTEVGQKALEQRAGTSSSASAGSPSPDTETPPTTPGAST